MKTTTSVPDAIFFKSAEKFANRVGVSRSQLYTKAVKEFLKEHQNDSVANKLNEVYAEGSSCLDRFDHNLQYASLPKDEW